jgi:hypothetical protein
LNHTNHSDYRCNCRNLSNADLDYICRYGTILRSGGALKYILLKRDIPTQDRGKQRPAQLEGTVVIINEETGTIITAYRNRDKGYKQESKKQKYNQKPAA